MFQHCTEIKFPDARCGSSLKCYLVLLLVFGIFYCFKLLPQIEYLNYSTGLELLPDYHTSSVNENAFIIKMADMYDEEINWNNY